MILTRRSFLVGALAAPIVVRSGVLMKVRPVVVAPRIFLGLSPALLEGAQVSYSASWSDLTWVQSSDKHSIGDVCFSEKGVANGVIAGALPGKGYWMMTNFGMSARNHVRLA